MVNIDIKKSIADQNSSETQGSKVQVEQEDQKNPETQGTEIQLEQDDTQVESKKKHVANEQLEPQELVKFEMVEADKSEIQSTDESVEQLELEREELVVQQAENQEQTVHVEQGEQQPDNQEQSVHVEQPHKPEQVGLQNVQHENQQEHGEQNQEGNILFPLTCSMCPRTILKLIRPQDIEKAKVYEIEHKAIERVKCNGIMKFFQIKQDNEGETNKKEPGFLDNAEFFQFGKKPYIRYEINGHWEIRCMEPKEFKSYFKYLYLKQYQECITDKVLYEYLEELKSKTIHEGKKIDLFPRAAWHNDEIWYDLVNDDWQAIKISTVGWSIEQPPIIFRRFDHQEQQVTPEKCADEKYLDRIFEIIKFNNKETELLFKVSLIAKFIPAIPHPIDVTYGPQGSSKSTLDTIKKLLVDPSKIKVCGMPSDIQELILMASHHLYIPFDNVSVIKDNQSDTFCRISTGEGLAKRALYTDDGEFITAFQHSISFNGINNPIIKPDLSDRCIMFELESLSDKKRMTERSIKKNFEDMKPGLLGAIFTTLSKAMAIKENVHLEDFPRMADFAEWGFAISEALESGGGERFLNINKANIKERTIDALQHEIVAEVLIRFMHENDNRKHGWIGTMSELYQQLFMRLEDLGISYDQKQFPKSHIALAKRINAIIINLKAAGIIVERFRDRRDPKVNDGKVERLVKITYVGTD